MRSLRFARTFGAWLALGLAGLTAAGCSSAASEDDDVAAEGALESPTTFGFVARSPKESAGEVEPANAYWAARFADMAYAFDDEAQFRKAFQAVGLDVAEVIPFHAGVATRGTTGTDGFYARTADAGFLVFRGTQENIGDVIADIRFIPVPAGPLANNAGEGRAHAGFTNALNVVWGPLRDTLKARHGNGKLPLYVMGHSLGGGLATMALHHLLFDGCLTNALRHIDVLSLCERDYIPVRAVYTFGEPRVGDETFMTTLARRARETGTKMFRFVNEGDQITMLPRYAPLPLVPAYRHPGENGDERANAIFLGRDGAVMPRGTGRCADSDKLVQCDIGLDELARNASAQKFPWQGEHSLRIYVEKLRAALTHTPPALEPIRTALANGQEPPAL
jgi:hypothetical protein